VVDQSGAIIQESLEGYKNLKPGSTVTVQGKIVRDGKDKKLVKIIATGLRPD
jgi:hypothetical protein